MSTALAALVLVPALVVGGARAGEAQAPAAGERAGDREQALELFEEALEHYRAGRFRQAADLLLRARELHAEPVLLYNLARAYEGLGELDNALDAYVRYLEEQPDAKDRGAIERRIETLREQIAERDRLARERAEREQRAQREPGAQTSGPGPGEPPAEQGLSAWPWVLAGAGVGVLAAGTALGVLSQRRRDEAGDDPVHRSAQRSFEQAEDFALAANVSFAVGGALVAAAATWITVELAGSDDDDDEVNVALLAGAGSLSARIRWGGSRAAGRQ